VFVALIALFLSFVVPVLSNEVQNALHTVQDAKGSAPNGSFKERVLSDLARHLQHLPSTDSLLRRSVSVGEQAVKVLVGLLLAVVPVIGPLAPLVLAVTVGLTSSWRVAVFAGVALLLIRLFEDYMVTPHVLGGAVGLPPLLTLISVSVTAILLGGFYVLLSIPVASLVATIVDVTLRGVDPAEVEVPPVIFPAQDT